MKQLTCEMCGGTDLIKQDGVFVCQNCGTSYSVEEARKMMVEGTVDVQGTVTVDNSSFVERYLRNARRAKEKTDWEEVEKYYNLVEQNDPENIEAIFYSAYGKAMLSLTEDSDRFKRQQRFDVFGKSISVIDDYYDVDKSAELKPYIQSMSADLIRMSQTNFVYQRTGQYSDDSRYTRVMFVQVELQFIESIENIIEKDEQPYLYELLILHYSRCLKTANRPTRALLQEKMAKVNERIAALGPDFAKQIGNRNAVSASNVQAAPKGKPGGLMLSGIIFILTGCLFLFFAIYGLARGVFAATLASLVMAVPMFVYGIKWVKTARKMKEEQARPQK